MNKTLKILSLLLLLFITLKAEPVCYHKITNSSILGDVLTLDDGSQWNVRPKDRSKLNYWNWEDYVFIRPSSSWFFSSGFELVNYNSGDSVHIKILAMPEYNGAYTHWITGSQANNRLIYLNDGSVWQVSRRDFSIIKEWTFNDIVMIGINNAWIANGSWYSSPAYILIDVNTNTYVRADRIQ